MSDSGESKKSKKIDVAIDFISGVSRIKTWSDVVAFSQLLMAIATLFIAIYTLKLWKTTDDLLLVSQKQVINNQKQNRPILALLTSFVSYRAPKDKNTSSGPSLEITSIELLIKNVGTTASYQTKVYADYRIVPMQDGTIIADKALLTDSYFLDGKHFGSSDLLGPGLEYRVSTKPRISLTNKEAEKMLSGNYALLLWGIITYTDAYDINHWLRFCDHYEDTSFLKKTSCYSYNGSD